MPGDPTTRDTYDKYRSNNNQMLFFEEYSHTQARPKKMYLCYPRDLRNVMKAVKILFLFCIILVSVGAHVLLSPRWPLQQHVETVLHILPFLPSHHMFRKVEAATIFCRNHWKVRDKDGNVRAKIATGYFTLLQTWAVLKVKLISILSVI